MNKKSRLLLALAAILLSFHFPSQAGAQQTANISIEKSTPDIPLATQTDLAAQLQSEFLQITEFLHIPPIQHLRVQITDRYRGEPVSVAQTFPDRQLILLPPSIVLRSIVPGAHELTHAIAGRGANNLLTEGLAVYVHDKFGRQPAFPTFRDNLKTALRRQSEQLQLAEPPNLLELQSWLEDFDRSSLRRLSYLLSGALVGFIIEEIYHGDIPRFMRLYQSGKWETETGLTLSRLEARFHQSHWFTP